jgi:ligand-binding SRPBCC domain-containing protein
VIPGAARARSAGVFRYHVLRREQRLPGTPDAVFPFFADARNLEAITPPWLGFRVITPDPIEMRVGALIEYRLRLRGLPLAWLTRIEDWTPGVRFVDAQLAGPYTLWHHTHEFAPDGAGDTIMRDTVRYALPFWPLGEVAHAVVVRRDLAAIFDFRHREVARRLTAP